MASSQSGAFVKNWKGRLRQRTASRRKVDFVDEWLAVRAGRTLTRRPCRPFAASSRLYPRRGLPSSDHLPTKSASLPPSAPPLGPSPLGHSPLGHSPTKLAFPIAVLHSYSPPAFSTRSHPLLVLTGRIRATLRYRHRSWTSSTAFTSCTAFLPVARRRSRSMT